MWDRSFARQRATKTNANCKRKAHKRKRKSVYGAKHNSNPESKGGRKEERKRTRASRRVTRVPTRKLKKRHNGKREEIGNATKGVKSALFLSRGSLWLRVCWWGALCRCVLPILAAQREVQLKLCRQLVLAVKAVAEVHAANAAVGVDLHS